MHWYASGSLPAKHRSVRSGEVVFRRSGFAVGSCDADERRSIDRATGSRGPEPVVPAGFRVETSKLVDGASSGGTSGAMAVCKGVKRQVQFRLGK